MHMQRFMYVFRPEISCFIVSLFTPATDASSTCVHFWRTMDSFFLLQGATINSEIKRQTAVMQVPD